MRLLARLLGLLAAAALLFIGFGYWGVTRPPVIVEASHRLPGLPPGARIRVLLLSDTHFGRPDMPAARLSAIVDQANALKPDLILLAGDYNGGKLIDMEPIPHLEPAVRPFARLKARLGVFAIMGNHDTMRWTAPVLAAQRSPVLLVNAHADIGPLVIAGANSVMHGSDIPGTLARLPAGQKPVLLLLHEGDQLAFETPPDRPVLALAGHTHGGQIFLPLIGSVGELLLGSTVCRRGLCTVNGWTLFVTSGVGASWVPLRIGVPPEMVLLTLHA